MGLPTIVSGYKCEDCGHVFEIPRDPEERSRLIQGHFEMPVIALPVGLVFLSNDFYEVVTSLDRIEVDHYSIHSIAGLDFNHPTGDHKGVLDHISNNVHAGVILSKFSRGQYRSLDDEEQREFSECYAETWAKELNVLEFILDPKKVPDDANESVRRGLARLVSR